MHSDMINKIEKAKRYAQEPERLTISGFQGRFHGADDHIIVLDGDTWTCDCNFFQSWGTCSHVMALQRLLAPMISTAARYAPTAVPTYEPEPIDELALELSV
ncbi:MAG TPA: hypothetical protein VFZ66_10325 [Herpetosiphonaceae bacterium]